MIVPIVFELTEDDAPCLWFFYKYMFFCLKNNYPIIALEEYFESPNKYKKTQPFVFKNSKKNYNELWEFPIPTDKDIEKLKKVSISKKEVNDITKHFKNKFDAWVNITKERNKYYETILERKIREIEDNYKEKIDVILTWMHYPSLEYVAKKHNIKLITEELTTLRKSTYNQCLGFFTFESKYSSNIVRKEYEQFKEQLKDIKLLSRKELLALFLSTDNLNYINKMDYRPEYEIGVDLGLDGDVFTYAYGKYSNRQIINKCLKLVDEDSIICRTHPMKPSNYKYKNMDNSPTSLDWILRCNRIVSSLSNVGFETMLFKRTSVILQDDIPFYVEAINNLNTLEEKVVSIDFLNYMMFVYFAPYQLLFDKDYIIWRATKNPTVKEIYIYNLKYILKRHNLSIKILNKTSKERINSILTKYHGFSVEETNKFINSMNENIVEKLQEENIKLNNELTQIKNSKGWKLIEKIRKIKNRRK